NRAKIASSASVMSIANLFLFGSRMAAANFFRHCVDCCGFTDRWSTILQHPNRTSPKKLASRRVLRLLDRLQMDGSECCVGFQQAPRRCHAVEHPTVTPQI